MPNLIRILLIEDDSQDIDLLQEYLTKAKRFQATLKTAESLAEGLECLASGEIDVVLCDLSLPDEQGLETFRQLHTQFPQMPIIILSGLDDEDVAVTALAEGAQDYLIKGLFNSNLLLRAIRYAIERQQLRRELQQQAQLLEDKVLERTAELKQANERLQGLEIELRRSLAQEKELSALKSRIITTISHEYRTPLTTIASSADLLEAYRHKWDDEKQLKHFSRIQATIEHMTALVNDVLFINQAEFEKLEFKPTPLNLESFFQELVDELQSTVSTEHHLTFTSFLNNTQANLDPKLLRQILTNLLSNAIKYSPNGGKIALLLKNEEKQVVFSCSDEGIGIPEEDQDKLFESFSRASNVGTIRGTGLGLSIVKKCVDLHNGQIVVESEVGVGTTFTVKLPIYNSNSTSTRLFLIEETSV